MTPQQETRIVNEIKATTDSRGDLFVLYIMVIVILLNSCNISDHSKEIDLVLKNQEQIIENLSEIKKTEFLKRLEEK